MASRVVSATARKGLVFRGSVRCPPGAPSPILPEHRRFFARQPPEHPILSAPGLDDQIRSHLETLEAAPGDLHAFQALESLYEGASRWEDLIALYEGRARVVHEPGAPLLARAANLAQS